MNVQLKWQHNMATDLQENGILTLLNALLNQLQGLL